MIVLATSRSYMDCAVNIRVLQNKGRLVMIKYLPRILPKLFATASPITVSMTTHREVKGREIPHAAPIR